MVGDTKLYLYLDPGRLIGDAVYSWDSRQFGGWVPHQVIAYLWPQGPWYWAFEQIGVPDWIAHRLWLGTLMVIAGLGVRWLARLLGVGSTAAVVAAAVYQLSPYVLPYASRTSAMLLPWAAVGWIVGLTIVAARSTSKWRAPAALALVLVSCSAVNATAVVMIAPAPVLWLIDAALRRSITWRAAVAVAARIAVLSTGVSAWWIAMLRIQGRYGADVLGFSESVEATSFTTASTEVLRGMGYWLFYIRDPYSFATSASSRYMGSGSLIAVGFLLLVVCLTGLAVVRWTARRYAALLVAVGTVVAVGVHPITDPSPLMDAVASNTRSALPLALRSSARAVPLVVLGLALGAAALTQALAGVSAHRSRARTATAAAPWLVVALAVLNMPVLFTGEIIDPALQRDEAPPGAWLAAAAALDATGSGARVLQLPGAEFGAYRWGYTADPPLVGLTDKPVITRDLLPLGSAQFLDLYFALDDRLQAGVLDPAAVAPVARLLGADTIWLPNDLAFDRYRNPWPSESYALLVDAAGLRLLDEFGDAVPNTAAVPMVDERLYGSWGPTRSTRPDSVALPPVSLLTVDDPVTTARVGTHVVVLAGSGDGVVDAAAAGLITGREVLVYAADLEGHSLGGAPIDPVLVVVTDSNRDRAHHWRSSQDVAGYTEVGGPTSGVTRVDEADARLPVFGDPDAIDSAQQTVAVLDGVTVSASGYGEGFAYLPEHRPAMAVDGDTSTSWLVGARGDPVGHTLTIDPEQSIDTLVLRQAHEVGDRFITEIRVTAQGGSTLVALDESSRQSAGPGQRVQVPGGGTGPVTIEITRVAAVPGISSPTSGVGFAELGVGPFPEFIRVPELPAVTDSSTPLAIVLSRLRVDPRSRWRDDPEPFIRRLFDVDTARAMSITVTLRLDTSAVDRLLATVLDPSAAAASTRLPGDPFAGGRSAVDGDLSTAWTSPFGAPAGATLEVDLDGPVDTFVVRQPVDGRHSTITELTVTAGPDRHVVEVAAPDPLGRSTVTLPASVDTPSMRLAVSGVKPLTTIDRRFGDTVALPFAVVEIESPAIASPSPVAAPATGCRDDLLEVDGAAVPLMITSADLEAIVQGEAVQVMSCDGLRLTPGTHRLDTSIAAGTALTVDRVVLMSDEPPVIAAPAAVDVRGTRTSRRLDVGPCPAGCWLVAGEGFNAEWTATLDGQRLAAPVPVAGGSLGWWLSPSDQARTIEMRWPPQRLLWVALSLSAAVVVLCIGILLTTPRSTVAAATGATPSLHDPRGVSVTSRQAWAIAAATVAVTAIVASPVTALVALPVAVVVAVVRRPRLLGVAAPLIAALIGSYMVLRQVSERIVPNQLWVLAWERAHRPGLLLVVFITLATVLDPREREPGATVADSGHTTTA
jgi:arabinofuranan 3-O-arabinosyltransferase